MAEGLDTAEKAGELWVEEHNVTSSASLKRPKSKEEKRLLRKMDLAIVPLLTLTFFIAYLVFPPFYGNCIWYWQNYHKDRNNLGNARVMGMQTDLHLTDEQFFNCLMMFCKF
jgi:hypothetical protein